MQKPCSEVYDEEHVSPQLWNQVHYMMCSDIGNGTMKVQGGDANLDVIADQTFFFVVDSCEHFANVTG